MHLLNILIDLPFVSTGDEEEEKKQVEQCVCERENDAIDLLRRRLAVYRVMLLRHKEEIESHENKTVRGLKELVKPRDPAISKLSSKIRDNYHPYLYEKNFEEASKKAIEKMHEILTIKLPVDFWMTFSEMLETGAADEMDKAILLCSLIRSLDCSDANVYVTDTKKPYLLFSQNEKGWLVDIEKGIINSGGKGDVLKKLAEDNKLLYSFNDREYQDLMEERL